MLSGLFCEFDAQLTQEVSPIEGFCRRDPRKGPASAPIVAEPGLFRQFREFAGQLFDVVGGLEVGVEPERLLELGLGHGLRPSTSVRNRSMQTDFGVRRCETDRHRQQLIAQQGLPQDPRFLQAYGVQVPRQVRLGLRFSF